MLVFEEDAGHVIVRKPKMQSYIVNGYVSKDRTHNVIFDIVR